MRSMPVKETGIGSVAEIRVKRVDVWKVNINESAESASPYGMRGFPTLILFQDANRHGRLSAENRNRSGTRRFRLSFNFQA
jgi:hypothetical protein